MSDQSITFTITTGRSGTGLLAYLLNNIPRVAAFHEPKPAFSDVMRSVQLQPSLATQFWRTRKLPAIQKLGQPIYVETSHLFCKGFVEPLLQLDICPNIILLSRSHRDVASSLYLLDTIPGRSKLGLKYCLAPSDPDCLQVRDWQKLSDYQLCFWYCLETERRSKIYRDLILSTGGKVADLRFEELTCGKLASVLDMLGVSEYSLPQPLRDSSSKPKIVNDKSKQKQRILPEDLCAQEDDLHQAIE